MFLRTEHPQLLLPWYAVLLPSMPVPRTHPISCSAAAHRRNSGVDAIARGGPIHRLPAGQSDAGSCRKRLAFDQP